MSEPLAGRLLGGARCAAVESQGGPVPFPVAPGPDIPSMHLYQALDDRETYAQAPLRAVNGSVALHE